MQVAPGSFFTGLCNCSGINCRAYGDGLSLTKVYRAEQLQGFLKFFYLFVLLQRWIDITGLGRHGVIYPFQIDTTVG